MRNREYNPKPTIKETKERKELVLIMTIIIMFFFMVGFVSANLGTFKQNECVKIRVLSNCSNVDLIEISNSNKTYELNTAMTNLGGQTFNYTFCNTSFIGTYSYSWNDPCIDCSLGGCGNEFEINPTGQPLTVQKSITYILIFIVMLLIFSALLILGLALPVSNKKDELTGYILAVNNLKYLKMLLLSFSYLVSMVISFFAYSFSRSYLDFDFLTKIFYFIFITQLILVLPFFILITYLLIANLIKDNKIHELLLRGLKIR